MDAYQAVKVTENIFWVGAIDWQLRSFHGYDTPNGTTYNAYLIRGNGGYVLVDGVKKGFEGELFSRIASVCDPREICAVISNHSEMDHSGALPEIMDMVSADAVLYASAAGVRALAAHFGGRLHPVVFENGASKTLCGREIRAIETRMMHWPDSMWTYDVEDGVLFTNDALGMHYASFERDAGEVPWSILEEEAATYYANILTLYGAPIRKLIESYPNLGLTPQVVCPDHGPWWRGGDIGKILGLYARWSDPARIRRNVVIAYDTMWHSTERLARAVGEGVSGEGVPCRIFEISKTPRSVVARHLLDAAGFAVGTPTLNGGMFPAVADLLCYVKGLRFGLGTGVAFGSYGWAPGGTRAVEEMLGGMCAKTLPALNVQYVPTDDDLVRARLLGVEIAKAVRDAGAS